MATTFRPSCSRTITALAAVLALTGFPEIGRASDFDLMVTTFGSDGFSTGLNLHLIRDTKSTYQGHAYTLVGTNADRCASYLEYLQRFPLEQMIKKGFLTKEQMEGLVRLEDRLRPHQVSFLTATSTLKLKDVVDYDRRTLAQLRAAGVNTDQFLSSDNLNAGDSQMSIAYRATQFRRRGTMWIVRGQSIDGSTGVSHPLPWRLDPNFVHVPPENASIDLSFEVGRGSANEANVFEALSRSAILAMVGEAFLKGVPLNRVKVYAHALTPAHVAHYAKFGPFRVAHRNPGGSDVVLELLLSEIFRESALLEHSTVVRKVSEAIGGALPPLQIKRALEVKKSLLIMDREFIHRGTRSRIFVKSSQGLTVAGMYVLYPKLFPGLTSDRYEAMIRAALEDSFSISAPVTGSLLKDPVHTQLASYWPERGWRIQNLDPAEAERSPDYALSAVKSTFTHLYNQLNTLSPRFIRSMENELEVSVLTSSPLIRDQLTRAGGSATAHHLVDENWQAILTMEPGTAPSADITYWIITFPLASMRPYTPANPAAARTEFEKLRSPHGQVLQKQIQEFLVD